MAAKKAVTDLLAAPASRIEELADLILQGELEPVDPRIMPFVAAGLQVYWVRLSREPRGPDSGNLKIPGVCPVCGSAPNAGIVLGDGPEKGLRYLCCSLCSTQWHTVRLTCSNCEATSGMTYYVIEGSGGAVKAECCNTCGTYLKLLYLEKDGEMDPIADDLSTMTLDMLLDGEGVVRCGPNLMYHPGG
jgi:FdhE protein